MTIQEMISAEEFEQQVRDCLPHLYDYSFLREHPLVHMLTPNVTGASKVQAFRQIVTETIERLRPDLGATFHSKQARIYNLLMLRYINQQQPQDVMAQLALSERQFYRDHPKAIQILSALLWEQLTGVASAVAVPTADATADISVESEVQRVYNQVEHNPVDLQALVDGAVQAAQTLASQHEIQIGSTLAEPLSIRGVNSPALRQAILLTLSQLITQGARGSQLEIGCEASKQSCEIVFTIQEKQGVAGHWEGVLSQQKSLHTLLSTIEGQFSVEESVVADEREQAHVTLKFPLKQQVVLLVDDNPGMLDLFERFLVGHAYRVLVAQDGQQAIQMARQFRPHVIILDVMLPGMDGWEVLQNLKTHPVTNNTPILVCSVLDAADLALSLGADLCLPKPPNQADFLNALARWQG